MHKDTPVLPATRSIAVGPGSKVRLPRLGLSVSERRILLATVDLFFVNLALYAAILAGGYNDVHIASMVTWSMLLSAIFLAAGYLLDAYDLRKAASPIHSLWATGGTAIVAGAVYVLIPYIASGLPERRLQIFVFALVATGGVTLWRVSYASILSQPQFHRAVLVIGAGWAGRDLANAIAENAHQPGNPVRGTGYHIIGYVDDDPQKQDMRIAGIPVVGTGDQLVEIVKKSQPDDIVVAINNKSGMRPELTRNVMQCYESGMRVTSMTGLYERVTERVPIHHAGSNLAVIFRMKRPATDRFFKVVKRLVDIAAGLAGCTATLLVAPFVVCANHFASPGDLFFRQSRVGLGGKAYQVIKFRSMVMHAEKATGAVWASESDPRITSVGRWLRRMRLDELPQSWNMLIGEMSLVGPRPERPEFVEKLTKTIPYYGARHAVKPGLTGWAQVKYQYGASEEDARVKLEYDLYYIKQQGFFMDFSILLKTVIVVLGLRGR